MSKLSPAQIEDFEKMTNIKIIDDDNGEINAYLGEWAMRGWVYSNRDEQRLKMQMAREFAEGWFQRGKASEPHSHVNGDLAGKDKYACALCGRDLRHDIHSPFSREVDPKTERRAADRLGNGLAPLFQ